MVPVQVRIAQAERLAGNTLPSYEMDALVLGRNARNLIRSLTLGLKFGGTCQNFYVRLYGWLTKLRASPSICMERLHHLASLIPYGSDGP